MFWPLPLWKTRHTNQISFTTIRVNHMKLLIICKSKPLSFSFSLPSLLSKNKFKKSGSIESTPNVQASNSAAHT